MEQKTIGRGIDARKQQVYTDAYQKEDRLRLKWFRKNEDRLVAFTEKPTVRSVPAQVLQQMTDDRRAHFKGVQKFPLSKLDDAVPPVVDPALLQSVMRPVDPKITQLIYTGVNRDGRINYLRQRVDTIPENRFYFPVTSNSVYGWNMWHSSRVATPVRYGVSYVVKRSFYRRNNVARDPDWYQEPEVLSPDVCSCA